MLVPHRTFSSPEYRYGFQGQEKDDEVKGNGNSLNFKFRMHDPRVGRFFAVDPLTPKYPHYSPYSFSGNKVVHMVELEGLEELSFKIHMSMYSGRPNLGLASYVTDWYNDKAKTKVDAAGRGVHKLASNIAVMRPMTLEESNELDNTGYLEYYKNLASNLKKIPSNLKKVIKEYGNTLEKGTAENKIESSIVLLGTVTSMLKGKGGNTIKGIASAGFKISTKSLIGANQLYKCKQFAKDFIKNKKSLNFIKPGDKIRHLEFKGVTDFIYHNGKEISKTGIHQVIEVTTKKGVYIYDNLNINGMLKGEWLKKFEIISKKGYKTGKAAMEAAKEIK